MFNSDFGRTVAAIACSIVLSATCVLGAVAPAHVDARTQVAEMAARPQA